MAAPARTQRVERREQAISRLLDATIQSLTEVGYVGTTVRSVASRAGVSQGGATHHFPQRLGMIVAALDELARRADEDLRARLDELPKAPGKRRAAAIDLLRTFFAGPHFAPWVRLWIAAAEDEELREAMLPVEQRLWDRLRAIALDTLPELADDPALAPRLAAVFSTLRGLGLQIHFDPRWDARRQDPWPAHRAAITLLLDADPSAFPTRLRRRSA